MKIKVCGMRDAENIAAVARYKPDYMGFVFYERSPRRAGNMLPEALDSLDELSPETRRVGVFVDADEEYILQTVCRFRLDFVQLHGHESPEMCARIAARLKDKKGEGQYRKTGFQGATGPCGVIKAFGVTTSNDLLQVADYEGVCDYFLLDTRAAEGESFGGTGRRFDHSLLEAYRGRTPLFLSGGIGPDDGAEFGAQSSGNQSYANCVAVDVNSRFETAPGVKDPELIKIFINAVRGGQKA